MVNIYIRLWETWSDSEPSSFVMVTLLKS